MKKLTDNVTIMKSWKPLVAVAAWGLSFIATKNVLHQISPLTLVFLRQVLGASFLFIFVFQKKMNLAIQVRTHTWVVILAIISTIHLGVQVTGLQWTSASNSGWIIGTSPVFLTILAFLFLKEKISFLQITGIITAFFGLLLLVSKGNFTSLSIVQNKGDLFIIISAFTWAVYSLVNKKAIVQYPPLMVTLYLFIFVAIILSPFVLNQENISAVIHLSTENWLYLAFLGIVCSGIATVLWAQALGEMPASQVGVFLYIQPFFTLLGSWLFLDEHITIFTIFSGLLILMGVMLVNKKQSKN